MCKVFAERITPQRIEGNAIVVMEGDYRQCQQAKVRKSVTVDFAADEAMCTFGDQAPEQATLEVTHSITGYFAEGKLYEFDFNIAYGPQFNKDDRYQLTHSLESSAGITDELDCDPEQVALLKSFIEVLFSRLGSNREELNNTIKMGRRERVRALEEALDEVESA
jgi:hypothetical protein